MYWIGLVVFRAISTLMGYLMTIAQSAGAVEYTDCASAEG